MELTEAQMVELRQALDRAAEAAEGDSNDEEIEALVEALDTALAILGVEREESI